MPVINVNKDVTDMKIFKAKPTVEGAGVNLKRVFGYNEVPSFDPFLMLDHFGSSDPADYLAGFPWHPHRGIETVTYMIAGIVDHGDSIGNSGTIGSGDVQWMTAGSGIIHQEMPQRFKGTMMGFQLWVNLPASKKMMEPRYRGITKDDIPEVTVEKGVSAKVISGDLAGTKGPVKDLVIDISYFDVKVEPNARFHLEVPDGRRAFIFVYAGRAVLGKGKAKGDELLAGQVGLLDDPGPVEVKAIGGPLHLMTASGRPIGEPIAWGGPIVMNTEVELELAFEEFNNGTFIKHGVMPMVGPWDAGKSARKDKDYQGPYRELN